jgi:hypothetical protein
LEPHVELQRGVRAQQPGEQRHDDAAAVGDRQVDAQRARRQGARAGRFGLQVFGLGEQALAGPVQPLAVGLPSRAARGAEAELALAAVPL